MSSAPRTEGGTTQHVTVLPGPLTEFTQGVLEAVDTPADIAGEVSRHLVGANLAGHDSHGVQRLPLYVGWVDRGTIDVAARPEVVHEQGACAVFDAHRGFGHYSTKVGLHWAFDHASEHGVASVAIRHSTHIGRVGAYAEEAVARGFLAMATVGSAGPDSGWTPPFGGRGRFLGTNPWALGAPAGEVPYVYDAATTTVAEGKVLLARERGAGLPSGWATDKEGRPTTTPAELYDGGALTPLGDGVAGHKGYGLGLGSALFGALSQAAAGSGADAALGGVWLLVVDPSAFGDAGAYRAAAAEKLEALKAVPPAPGFDEVLVPGEPETRSRERRGGGIPIPAATWGALLGLAERFEVPIPSA